MEHRAEAAGAAAGGGVGRVRARVRVKVKVRVRVRVRSGNVRRASKGDSRRREFGKCEMRNGKWAESAVHLGGVGFSLTMGGASAFFWRVLTATHKHRG